LRQILRIERNSARAVGWARVFAPRQRRDVDEPTYGTAPAWTILWRVGGREILALAHFPC
jgi:hypothetical protein